jgi:hypothetical protein
MKTTSKFITACLIAATATMIVFTSCQDPQPANDVPPVDTTKQEQPVDTAAAPVDTTASAIDATAKHLNEKADENKK